MIPNFLQHLKDTASSPFAFVAYVCVVAAWVYVIVARHRLKTIAQILKDVPEDRRAEILLREYNTTPRAGLSAEQWIRSRKQTLFFISFLATLIALIAIVGITFSLNSKGQPSGVNGVTERSNNNAAGNTDDEIPPLKDPVDVTHPSPTPNNKQKDKSSNNSSNSDSVNKTSSQTHSPINIFSVPTNLTTDQFRESDFRRANFISPAPNVINSPGLLTEPKHQTSLELYRIEEGLSGSESTRVFDITIANKSKGQKLLKDFEVKWNYSAGGGASNEKPYLLKPTAKYKIVMPIDRRKLQDKKVQPVYPHLVIPPGSQAEPNLVTIRLYLSYTIDIHPYTNWDILFSLSITDDKGGRVTIFSERSWKDRPHKDPY